MNVSSARSYREWEMQERITDFWYFLDHPTPICIRTHTADNVPYLLYDSRKEEHHTYHYNEKEAAETGILKEEGHKLIDELFS